MAFNCSTSNINCTQGIGEGIMNIIRGGVQFAVESVDRALGTSYGAVDLAAVGVLLIVMFGPTDSYIPAGTFAGRRVGEGIVWRSGD